MPINRTRRRNSDPGIRPYSVLLGLGLLAALFAITAHGAEGDTVTTALPKVAPAEFNGDLGQAARGLVTPGPPRERVYRPRPLAPVLPKSEVPGNIPERAAHAEIALKAAMPGPAQNFQGIASNDTCAGGQCGPAVPPDPNGEVGANHYIQAVNEAYGIFSKTGTLLASFTEDRLWSGTGTLCDGQSRGDPVVIYDALADRWILTHFAFGFSGNNTAAPYFQCIAVSKTGDPVAGGWWLYALRVDDASHPWLNDYGKFGIWTDCLYMSANEFSGAGVFQGTLFASFSRADMYAGLPLTWSLGFIANATTPFSMVPSHLGGQAGAVVPAGTPNYFVSESQTLFAFEVRKFTAGPNCGAGGTLGAPTVVAQTSYTVAFGAVAPQPGTSITLDVIDDRVMQKVQYRKLGGQESLWVAHVFRTSAAGVTGVQWAQINVTGGSVATTPLQQQKYDPADTRYRYMPSLAVDGQGNMALGYSTSSAVAPNYPSIAYSGRLAGDALNTLPQTETQLIAGGGSQTGNCGGAPCDRWGDYSSLSADPADDCTFWITNEYYPGPFNSNTTAWHTRIGSFRFPSCASSNRTADLAISKTDGATAVSPGAPISYTIVAANNGPFAVSGATVTDTLPSAIGGATWTCTASPGSSCPAAGAGSINTSAVNLQSGGTVTFTISGTVSPSASGSLNNTATIAVPSGFTDPNPGNNSATDIDSITPPAGPPIIAKAFGVSPITVGQTSLLTITITNPNAGTALTGVAFSDTLPAGVTAANASFSGCGGIVAVSANVITLSSGTLAAGGSCSLPLTVTGVLVQATAWTNTINSVTSTQGGTNGTPATASITVNKASTTTAIGTHTPNPSTVGSPIAVSASVTVTAPGAGTPSGAITVSDGTTSCLITLPATSCNLTPLSNGAKTLTATYAGDGSFNGSASPGIAHTVNLGGTTTLVSPSPNPSVFGQSVTLTATVTGNAPSGTVTFNDGASPLCSAVALVGGQAQCITNSLTVGSHSITATYSGNSSNAGSTSPVVSQIVNKASTTTAIGTHTPNPATVGSPIAVSAIVTVTAPGAGTPSGAITVSDGTANCLITLPATNCNLTPLSNGVKTLTATYAGDGAFNGSIAPGVAHSVNLETAPAPTLQSAVSRKHHGTVGDFDLLLSLVATDPSTEPRQGPTATLIFTFDKPITGAAVSITEGVATAIPPTYSGNDVVVGLTGVANVSYVTVALTNVASDDGGIGGSGSVRIGFLLGDVNGNRNVTLADMVQLNAVLTQDVTAETFLRDVNLSGTLTLADKLMMNGHLTQFLPAP